MYFDGGYPFDDGAEGRRLVAHYYNVNARWHEGRNEAAMCIKKWPAEKKTGAFRDGTCVQDIERGRAGESFTRRFGPNHGHIRGRQCVFSDLDPFGIRENGHCSHA